MVKRILHYVHATVAYSLPIQKVYLDAMVAYSDADWAGYQDTRRSTIGFCVFLGTTLISAKK